MAESFARTRFLLETGPSHRLNDQLDARALDVIVAADIGAPADWMEVHPLIEEPFLAAAPRGVAGGLDNLRALPLIQYSSRHRMGRVIAEHLARQDLALAHRFELDSYHAIMAMVAAGAGWTILTPLGVLRAHRFVDAVDLHPLPVDPLSRRISLVGAGGRAGRDAGGAVGQAETPSGRADRGAGGGALRVPEGRSAGLVSGGSDFEIALRTLFLRRSCRLASGRPHDVGHSRWLIWDVAGAPA